MMQDRRLTINAELRANEPVSQKVTPPTDSDNEDNQDNTSQEDKPAQTSPKKLSGYAIVWNTPSKDLGGFKEVVSPNALKGVDLSNVLMLNDHDYTKVLASVKAGTLKLTPDDKGLHFEATLPDTTTANDVFANVQAGNLDSCSFSFDVDDGADKWDRDDQGNITRTINQIKDLFDVSVVAVPAYDSTNISTDKKNVNVNTRSYEQFIKGEDEKMDKTIIDGNNGSETKSATRSFEDFIRSRGELRDGLTTSGVQAVIPEEVVTPVLQLKNSKYNLAQYATVKTVSSGSGHYPIAKRNNTAVLATKEELADIADVDANMFEDVKFDVKTRAGKIALSNEIVDDSAVDIVSEVKNQLQKLVDNTDNKNIMDVLTGDTFKKEKATTTDDLKKIFNVDLDPALNKTWFVNQSGFNYLDTLKDNEGRYLLQPNPTAASGFALFGAPVVMISDVVMPNNSDGSFPMIIGDIAEAVVVFRRNQVTAQWDKFDQFAQGLSVIVRNDYQPISADAAINVSLSNGTTPSK
ncbi:phage major capsid protein [Limosilactobacillus reuteri]|nr:phage major capsid protein [Limosilactobacillus reuteri]MCC4435846.1 phage major capsid protein [Limosilactobacillus reuteri]MCC4438166.1 phage major capsid protein [Limosilactobacillus reuteri]MCC4442644.1 phage major capsid protein [Limosilactobacillus reuteri]MCC4444234.1 phage major capsid protein [Limosilactobacillus reuteri]MCC4445920.1 phage major capsid protein [Limosilactobacillus reuteri]